MPEIPLSNSDEVALVDEDDYHYINSFIWHKTNKGYAATRLPKHHPYSGKRVSMHRLIMDMVEDSEYGVDHINRNKLDNRSSNLRKATNEENAQNRELINKSSASQYRGVSPAATKGKWLAHGAVAGGRYYLGTFESELEAAQYAAAWRRDHHTHHNPDDEELAKAFPDPIPLKPRSGKRASYVVENKTSYSIYLYDKGMGSKCRLLVESIPKTEITVEEAYLKQRQYQEWWDNKEFDKVNAIREARE